MTREKKERGAARIRTGDGGFAIGTSVMVTICNTKRYVVPKTRLIHHVHHTLRTVANSQFRGQAGPRIATLPTLRHCRPAGVLSPDIGHLSRRSPSGPVSRWFGRVSTAVIVRLFSDSISSSVVIHVVACRNMSRFVIKPFYVKSKVIGKQPFSLDNTGFFHLLKVTLKCPTIDARANLFHVSNG